MRGRCASAAALPGTPPLIEAGPGPTPDGALLAGGCFWGMEAIYEEVRGSKSVETGYAALSGTQPATPEVKPAAHGAMAEGIRHSPTTPPR